MAWRETRREKSNLHSVGVAVLFLEASTHKEAWRALPRTKPSRVKACRGVASGDHYRRCLSPPPPRSSRADVVEAQPTGQDLSVSLSSLREEGIASLLKVLTCRRVEHSPRTSNTGGKTRRETGSRDPLHFPEQKRLPSPSLGNTFLGLALHVAPVTSNICQRRSSELTRSFAVEFCSLRHALKEAATTHTCFCSHLTRVAFFRVS